MKTFAYARVSALDQNVSRQIDAFTSYGVENKFIYVDKRSGKDFERENYKLLLKKIKKGDLLVIKSIDRLGRNYNAIINEWNYITNIIGADILVLDMPLLDTRSKSDTLVGKFISDVVLQILSFVAENERINIKQRQKEGINSAKKRGVRFGRPQKIYTATFISIFQEYYNNKICLSNAIYQLNIKRSNFYYHANRLKKLGYIK